MTTATAGFGAYAAPRLRMTQRGRRVLAALIAIPLVIAALAIGLNGGMASAGSDSTPLTYVSVEAGQSLWNLAEQVAPNADPRDVVYDIQQLNQLTSTQLVPGEQLAIPSKYSH